MIPGGDFGVRDSLGNCQTVGECTYLKQLAPLPGDVAYIECMYLRSWEERRLRLGTLPTYLFVESYRPTSSIYSYFAVLIKV